MPTPLALPTVDVELTHNRSHDRELLLILQRHTGFHHQPAAVRTHGARQRAEPEAVQDEGGDQGHASGEEGFSEQAKMGCGRRLFPQR